MSKFIIHHFFPSSESLPLGVDKTRFDIIRGTATLDTVKSVLDRKVPMLAYSAVATLLIDSSFTLDRQLEMVFDLTNSTETHWTNNREVAERMSPRLRSLSVGDIVQSETHYHVVANTSFEVVCPVYKEDAELRAAVEVSNVRTKAKLLYEEFNRSIEPLGVINLQASNRLMAMFAVQYVTISYIPVLDAMYSLQEERIAADAALIAAASRHF